MGTSGPGQMKGPCKLRKTRAKAQAGEGQGGQRSWSFWVQRKPGPGGRGSSSEASGVTSDLLNLIVIATGKSLRNFRLSFPSMKYLGFSLSPDFVARIVNEPEMWGTFKEIVSV